MRLETLGLERYGHFTDVVLQFFAGDRITVVLGANEAGKTTALSAIADVLFGMETRSNYNFRHDYKEMRLSATITSSEGRSLHFARVKRSKLTLLNPETDAPLPEDCLAPFLGAHHRQAFLDNFGLDQRRLRAGGEALRAGGGDLAETLIATAPGLAPIARLRDRLEAEAAPLYNPKRKNAGDAFYVALKAHSDAVQRLRTQELRVEVVEAHRATLEAARNAHAKALEQERAAGLAFREAETLARAAGEIRALDLAAAKRAALGEVPEVGPDFILKARKTLLDHAEAQTALQHARREEAAARASFESIITDPVILDHADAVEACDETRAKIRNEQDDVPKRLREAADAHAGLSRIAGALGLADVQDLSARLPGQPMLVRAGALIRRLSIAIAQAERLIEEQARLSAASHAHRARRAALGEAIDPAPFRRALNRLNGAEERLRLLKAREARVETLERSLSDEVLRLGLGLAGPDALAKLALPSLAAAEAALSAIKAAEDAILRQKEAEIDLTEKREHLQIRLAALHAGHPAPTEQVIMAARDRRDALWQQLRPLAFGARKAAPEDQESALALDAALEDADRRADERQRESTRLADLAQGEREMRDINASLRAAAARRAAAEAQGMAASTAWRKLWVARGFSPAADGESLTLLRSAEAIRSARDILLQERTDLESARHAVAQDDTQADAVRAMLGLPAREAASTDIVTLSEAIEVLEKRAETQRTLEAEARQLEKTRHDLAVDSNKNETARAELDEEIREVFTALAIRLEASPEEAQAALVLRNEALPLIEKRDTAAHRITAMEENAIAFAARTKALVEALGMAMEDTPLQAARRLKERLDAARRIEDKAQTASDALTARAHAAQIAARAASDQEETLQALLSISGLAEATALPGLIERLEEMAGIRKAEAEARRRLMGIIHPRSEAEVRAALLGQDADALSLAIGEAESAHHAAKEALHQAIAALSTAQAALDALQNSMGAAEAAQDAQNALTEIRNVAERFIHAHIGARLLARSIEQYRAAHQNPLILRASGAFRTLTRGRWEGLKIDYDHEAPQLAAAREGRLFGVEALSEGTRDQLYLALRVAAIEDHARCATPLPFIADDLFVSFDEARTEAGFRFLAELAETTQVIVFTHHAYVAESAMRALENGVRVIHLGEKPQLAV